MGAMASLILFLRNHYSLSGFVRLLSLSYFLGTDTLGRVHNIDGKKGKRMSFCSYRAQIAQVWQLLVCFVHPFLYSEYTQSTIKLTLCGLQCNGRSKKKPKLGEDAHNVSCASLNYARSKVTLKNAELP